MDRVNHRSPCPPRNGTGVRLLEASLRVRMTSGNRPEPVLVSSYPDMSKIVQLLRSCSYPRSTERMLRFIKIDRAKDAVVLDIRNPNYAKAFLELNATFAEQLEGTGDT